MFLFSFVIELNTLTRLIASLLDTVKAYLDFYSSVLEPNNKQSDNSENEQKEESVTISTNL